MLNIRPYNTFDHSHVLGLFDLNCPTYFSPGERDPFTYYLTHEREDYFVAERDGRVLGAGGINYTIELDGDACLSWGMVHPDFHKQGIGTALTKHRINWVRQKLGEGTLIVRTAQFTDKFYEKMGFELQRIDKDLWAPGYHGYIMHMNFANDEK